jgi:hypothetical protein
VDKIAYALVKEDPYYDLDVKVNTKGLAQQGKDITTLGGLIPILNSITQPDGPVTYTLKPCGEKADLERFSGLVIAEGYGCAGYANADCVKIAAATLNTLTPGTYYLYALGTKGQKVVAVDQTCIGIFEVPKPTKPPSGGGGGGGVSPVKPESPISYDEKGILTTDSEGIVAHSIVVGASDGVASLLVPAGVKALDKDGKPLSEITLTPLASDKMPVVPSGALFKFAGYVYEAGPDGATFDPAITLTFNLPEDDWNALDPDTNDFKVKWYNEVTEQWEDVPTTISKSTKSITAKITHFSIFALFTEPVTTTPPVDIDIPTTPPVDEKPPAGEFPTTIFAIVVVLVIVIAAGYFFIVRK